MLYDFHQRQNAKTPSIVHAIYLMAGAKSLRKTIYGRGSNQEDGENSDIRNSPFMSSSMPQDEEEAIIPALMVITLVREEHLEG